jgi:molybdenum cofactor cytidylyltransferase
MSGNAIFAIVLAAGASSRFGRTKQLEPFEGVPLAAGVVRKAESVCGGRTVLVVGKDWQEVAAACEPLAGFFVINEDYEQGIASSIACGVRAVADGADAILLTMADLPLVTAEHLSKLAETWTNSPLSIVASAFADTLGPPAIFPKTDFDALLELQGDRGARQVLEANRDRVLQISCEEAAFDIDRPEDLAGIY